MSSMIRKVQNKIKTAGFKGLFEASLNTYLRVSKKKFFKFKASVFLKKIETGRGLRRFKIKPIQVVLGEKYPTQEIVTKITKNQYVILSQDYVDWGVSHVPGHLAWYEDKVARVRWPHSQWGVDIPITTGNGDIKRLWELGRLHQLVQLGLCYQNISPEQTSSKGNLKETIAELASSLLLHFHHSNPDFLGPQWMCAMDVAIRWANISLAVDLLGDSFYQKHAQVLDYELTRHLFYIENNLENQRGHVVNNHYLADLTGLAFGLSHQQETKTIEAQALIYQLVHEMMTQFGSDGGNFEGSTYYHRLSGELAFFGLATLLESFPKVKLSREAVDRMQKISDFSKLITDCQGYVPQIGDNDSGHLFIANPVAYFENDLHHRYFISFAEEFLHQVKAHRFDWSTLVQSFCVDTHPKDLAPTASLPRFNPDVFAKTLSEVPGLKNCRRYEVAIKHAENLTLFSLADFGLYGVKGPDFDLYFRAGQNPRDHHRGHCHVDQLSIHLAVKDEKNFFRDPGTYSYTEHPKERNKLRAANIHQVPITEFEDISAGENLFTLTGFKGQIHYAGVNGFYGSFTSSNETFYRLVQIHETQIVIYDWAGSGSELIELDFKQTCFSHRYGELTLLPTE